LHSFEEGYEGDFGLADDGADEAVEGEVDMEAFEEATAAAGKGASKRSVNYMEKDNIALLNAWESISLNAVTSND
jgi:hypothetical protein